MRVPELVSERLLLRPYREEDLEDLLALIGAREVAATTLRIPHPYSREHGVAYISHSPGEAERGESIRLAITLRQGQVFLGGIGLVLEAEHNRAELGYWLGVPHWGKGYATEAAAAVQRYGFEELKLNRIFASHTQNNPASGRVLTKIGMSREGCARQHIQKWGEFLDLELYASLRSEYGKG